jgi:hypothetical protein
MDKRGSEKLLEWLAGRLSDDPMISGDIAASVSNEAERNRLPPAGVVRIGHREEGFVEKEDAAGPQPVFTAATAFTGKSFPILVLVAFYGLYVLAIVGGAAVFMFLRWDGLQ